MLIPEPNTWTKVERTSDAYIYPIIRKPSITCSSSFIIKTPWQIIIIDPGADISQVEHIRHVVLPICKGISPPVYIFLTHCHVDHFLAMPLLMDNELHGQLVCHAKAARAIEEKDETLTMANMIDIKLPTCNVHARFFEPLKGDALARGPLFALKDTRFEMPDGRAVLTQSYQVSQEDTMDIIHTPGHSPDGLCYKIGSCMITGDLHLATTPGIVGLAGWDNMELAASLEVIIQKGKQDNVTVVLPGHGIPFAFDRAEKIFSNVRKEAFKLSGIALLNRERSDYLSEYAIVLLEEASNIFSIIAARLLKISYYLEFLEEEDRARTTLESLDIDAIEKMVDEFYYFTAELKGQGGVPLISKSVQFARSVENVFAPEKVSHLFDGFLLHRLKSLLSDFTNAAYGIRFQNQEMVFDMNLALGELLKALRETPHKSESIFDSLEDDEQFIAELTKRLAYEPIFSAIQLNFEPCKDPLMVLADRNIFQDMVCALLEQYAISGIVSVALRSETENEKAVLKITEGAGERKFELRDSKLSYLRHSMKIAGGEFSTTTNGIRYYIFNLPLQV